MYVRDVGPSLEDLVLGCDDESAAQRAYCRAVRAAGSSPVCRRRAPWSSSNRCQVLSATFKLWCFCLVSGQESRSPSRMLITCTCKICHPSLSFVLLSPYFSFSFLSRSKGGEKLLERKRKGGRWRVSQSRASMPHQAGSSLCICMRVQELAADVRQE